jgi:protein-L-isoaspartate(D-aspartate) O-methyltransferase
MAWRCSGATNAELIDNLATANIIKSELIKNAFKSVDRGNYAPSNPYQDGPQGIGFQVTISAPHMHAHALENLQNVITKEGSRVLDVGCGSGYLAAVMSRFNPSATIFGIDYIPQLVELSINNTKKVILTHHLLNLSR